MLANPLMLDRILLLLLLKWFCLLYCIKMYHGYQGKETSQYLRKNIQARPLNYAVRFSFGFAVCSIQFFLRL